MMAMAFVEFENVSKIYKTGEVEISALHGASFTVEQGEICVIVGASGAGKTTLLNILGGMDTLTSGTVKLDGRDISRYNRRQLTEYRRRDVGFVFQFYNLIQNLTALENVEIAAQLCEHPLDAAEVLREVGLLVRLGVVFFGDVRNKAQIVLNEHVARLNVARKHALDVFLFLLCRERTRERAARQVEREQHGVRKQIKCNRQHKNASSFSPSYGRMGSPYAVLLSMT